MLIPYSIPFTLPCVESSDSLDHKLNAGYVPTRYPVLKRSQGKYLIPGPLPPHSCMNPVPPPSLVPWTFPARADFLLIRQSTSRAALRRMHQPSRIFSKARRRAVCNSSSQGLARGWCHLMVTASCALARSSFMPRSKRREHWLKPFITLFGQPNFTSMSANYEG